MKKILKYTLLLLTLALLFAGCQKDVVTYNDGYDDQLKPLGPPKISKITLAKDVSTEPAEIEGASLTTMVAIHGSNLSQVVSLKFNDVEVDVSQIYARNPKIVVAIPRILPEEVNNLITVTTELGSVTKEFHVSIPELEIVGFENEFATPGDTLKIVGNHFDLYDLTKESSLVTMAGVELVLFEAGVDYLSVVMPAGTGDNQEVEISGGKMEGSVVVPFRMVGTPIMIFEGLWSDDYNITDGTAAGDPQPPFGIEKFLRLNKDLGAWDWHTFYGGGYDLEDPEVETNPEKYELRFEVNTSKSIAFGNILLEANGEAQRTSWNPAEGGIPFNTDKKWKTVRLELVDCGWILKPGWNGFSMTYQPSSDTSVDFSIANPRVVKKSENR